jgi:hypothetical protein
MCGAVIVADMRAIVFVSFRKIYTKIKCLTNIFFWIDFMKCGF